MATVARCRCSLLFDSLAVGGADGEADALCDLAVAPLDAKYSADAEERFDRARQPLRFNTMTGTIRATFRLAHSLQEPLELSVLYPPIAMALVHRDAVGKLEGKWPRAIGVYVLIGPCDDGEHEYRAYVGKSETGGLKERLTTHRNSPTWEKSHGLGKEWWKRSLLVRSNHEDGFNSLQAGWLEGRLWDLLDRAPAAQLIGKKGKCATLTEDERSVLDQFLPPITAVLRTIA